MDTRKFALRWLQVRNVVSEIVGMDALQDVDSSAFGPMCLANLGLWRPANLALERERERQGKKQTTNIIPICCLLLQAGVANFETFGHFVFCVLRKHLQVSVSGGQVLVSWSIYAAFFFGTAVTVRTRHWCSLAWPVSLLFEPWELWPLMRILAEI